MPVVFDIEADKLVNPSIIWLVVAKDLTKGTTHVFRDVQTEEGRSRFLAFWRTVDTYVGHNWLEYDYPVIRRLLGADFEIHDVALRSVDTLVLSRLADYTRQGTDLDGDAPAVVAAKSRHSVAAYGLQFGFPKIEFSDFSQYSPEMEEYCVRDVLITEKIYNLHKAYAEKYPEALRLEQEFQFYVINALQTNGFTFNTGKAEKLLDKVKKELGELDAKISEAFPTKRVVVREFTPKATKYGTISKTSVPRSLWGSISEYKVGTSYPLYAEKTFNPASHKQLIEVLHEAGWSPVDKTKAHIDFDRQRTKVLDTKDILKYGWKINETNLSTLPSSAPEPARLLAKRILLESRRRTLTEWIKLVCTEIKIEKGSIDVLGQRIKEEMIRCGVPRSANITERDVENEILNYLENHTCTTELFTHKKNENVNTTFSLPTELLCKTLINWLKSKKVSVNFVVEKESCLWITITERERLEGFYVNLAIQSLVGLKRDGLRFSIISERIKGRFFGIGAWTHRMAHQQPNTANIPNDLDTQGKKKLLGKELRSLWMAPKNRLLVGVDAEGIQLRVFAHLIDDKEFTDALVNGRKENKTDPHSLNQRILGRVCKSRAAAKRFIYALLLGAGLWKLAQILECSETECKEALNRLLTRYSGYQRLKESVIPRDANKGYFIGLDGRKVCIPGSTVGERKHLAMSGYLQSGEAIIMKKASLKFIGGLKDVNASLVNLVHDEWQTEVPNNMGVALRIAALQSQALVDTGVELKLKCPLAGSFYNDDIHDYTIGTNWSVTH